MRGVLIKDPGVHFNYTTVRAGGAYVPNCYIVELAGVDESLPAGSQAAVAGAGSGSSARRRLLHAAASHRRQVRDASQFFR